MNGQLTIDFDGSSKRGPESQFSLCVICGNLCLPDTPIVGGGVRCELCEDDRGGALGSFLGEKRPITTTTPILSKIVR